MYAVCAVYEWIEGDGPLCFSYHIASLEYTCTLIFPNLLTGFLLDQ